MIEEAKTSAKTSVKIHQTTRRHTPEHCNLHMYYALETPKSSTESATVLAMPLTL
jgi:hypothetical protein